MAPLRRSRANITSTQDTFASTSPTESTNMELPNKKNMLLYGDDHNSYNVITNSQNKNQLSSSSTTNMFVEKESIFSLGKRNRDIDEETWDNIDMNTIKLSKLTKENARRKEQEELARRQASLWDTHLDMGKLKKVKAKQQESTLVASASNKFQDFFESGKNRKLYK